MSEFRLPTSVIKKLSETYANQTIENIKYNLKRVYKEVFNTSVFNPNLLLKERDKVFTYLFMNTDKKPKKIDDIKSLFNINPSSAKVILNNVINVLRTYDGVEKDKRFKEYLENFKIISAYEDKLRDTAVIAEEKKENHITMKEITKKRLEFQHELGKKYDPVNDQAYILLLMFENLPIMRNQDYCSTVLIDKVQDLEDYDKHSNYIAFNKKVWVIREYKTEKTHGTREIPIPQNIINILKEYKNRRNGAFPLVSYYSDVFKPMKSDTLRHFLHNNVFDKRKISCSELRKMYVSEKIIDEKMNKKERYEVAEQMGQTIPTQNKDYVKYSKLIV